jgi:hypothetical protein
MPMASSLDHGAQDPDNPYCVHCTDMNGKLLSFEKKFEDFVEQAMRNRWMSREQAIVTVVREMEQRPAWRNKVPRAVSSG